MTIATNLGFSRMGPYRDLKKALERFWAKKSEAGELLATASRLREAHWKLQQGLGLAQVPCNDFSLYDHILDVALMVGVRPGRFEGVAKGLDRYFAIDRGVALAVLSPEQLWVNPDCGLKTRRWEEVKTAVATLVKAARAQRRRLAEASAGEGGAR